MWSDTAVIYRKNGEEVECTTLKGCYFERLVEQRQDSLGRVSEGKGLLIADGDIDVQVGDLVAEGPALPAPRWSQLVGSGFCRVRQVKKWRLNGRVHHTEVFCGK